MNTYQTFQEKCRKGNHPFDEVYRDERYLTGVELSTVVRWCPVCGTVVVDEEFDGRVKPGYVMEAKRPAILEGSWQK